MSRSRRIALAAVTALGLACGEYSIGSIASTEDGGTSTTTEASGSSSSGSTSAADGSSGIDGGCDPCPSLQDGATEIGRDPRIDGLFRTVADLRTQVDVARDAYTFWMNDVATAWGYGGDTSPTPAAMAGLVAHIEAELFASIDGPRVMQIDRVLCVASLTLAVSEQLGCELTLGCVQDQACAQALFVDAIDFACGGTCFGMCDGACADWAMCEPQPASGIACTQICYGDCMIASQPCAGTCEGECDGAVGFAGVCPGLCTGTCAMAEGGACIGQCFGWCYEPAIDLVGCPTESTHCVEACAGACAGDCLGKPRWSVAEECGEPPCSDAADCVADLRAIVTPICYPFFADAVATPSATLPPDQAAALRAKLDAFEVELPFVLEPHARLAFVVEGDLEGRGPLLNPAITPAPAVQLSQRLALISGIAGSLDVPCTECALVGLADAIAITNAATEEARGLVETGDVLREWLDQQW